MRILLRLSALLIVSLASVAPAVAQTTPVPVHEDPMHRIVFENDHVRLIEVRIPVGTTSLYHRHVIPSAIVYLTPASNRSESWPEKEIVTREVLPGQSRYAAYDEKALAHRVTNTGTALFHVFDIELLRKKPAEKPAASAPLASAAKIHWDEALVRSSGLTLERGATTRLAAPRTALLLVGIRGEIRATPSNAGAVTLRAGAYAFFAAGTTLDLAAAGAESAELVVLELR